MFSKKVLDLSVNIISIYEFFTQFTLKEMLMDFNILYFNGKGMDIGLLVFYLSDPDNISELFQKKYDC